MTGTEQGQNQGFQQSQLLSPQFYPRNRMQELLLQMEREYNLLYEENIALKARLGIPVDQQYIGSALQLQLQSQSQMPQAQLQSSTPLKGAGLSSSSKASSQKWTISKELTGHHDGVWESTPSPWDDLSFATASVDRSARLWSSASGACTFVYYGHKGSVNSVRMSPTERFLCCTASGDRTCHIFRIPDVSKKHSSQQGQGQQGQQGQGQQSGMSQGQQGQGQQGQGQGQSQLPESRKLWGPLIDPGSPIVEEQDFDDRARVQHEAAHPSYLRSPLIELRGHKNVVIAADWVHGGDRIVSASWDNTVRLWSAATGEQQLQVSAGGHVDRFHPTNITVHPSSPLALWSGSDGTFCLWDLRSKRVSLSSIQAHHAESCSTAVFDADGECIVTSGADKHVRIWDIRALGKSSKSDFRGAASLGRFTLPRARMVIVPQDNDAHILDYSGKCQGKLKRRPRNSILSSFCWLERDKTIISTMFSGSIHEWSKSVPIALK